MTVAFIAFLLIRQSLGRLWHSANGMRGGRTGRFGLTRMPHQDARSAPSCNSL
jgi:hypothetical protein